MSALNNAWNSVSQYNNAWQDPRSQYQQQGFPSGRPAPRKQDMPESMLQEMSADPSAQRYWYQMEVDRQWELIERYQKQEEDAKRRALADAYDPNNDEAYSVSLSTAVDLWRVKHGDAWVKEQSVYVTGDFYGELENRLCNNNCFERMTKHDRHWVRLKENV